LARTAAGAVQGKEAKRAKKKRRKKKNVPKGSQGGEKEFRR